MGFETCGPNEAMVVSGCGYGTPLMIPGGRVWKWPVIQRVQRISLNIMTLRIKSSEGCSNILCWSCSGENSWSKSRDACMQFLGKTEGQIQEVTLETLEGHQRAIMGNMGITVVSYTLKDITDREGYLAAHGYARTAQVHRDARIGEAEARRDASIKEAQANQEKMKAKFENDSKIAKAKRDFELKKALCDKEVSTKKAESDFAYNLQEAITKQSIKNAEMQIKVEERAKQIQVQEQEISRREKDLTAQASPVVGNYKTLCLVLAGESQNSTKSLYRSSQVLI